MSQMSPVLLASSVALKSNYNNKYLRYVSKNEEEIERFRFLHFSGEQILSPDVKFEIEQSTTDGNDGLVHIRSSYSNKYWRRQKKGSNWIVAEADKPEENKDIWECTLFQPLQVQAEDDDHDNNKIVIRLRHVQLGHYLKLFSPVKKIYNECLFAEKSTISDSKSDLFTVTKWASLVDLPKYICLKDYNGKYLTQTDLNIVRFSSTDVGDEGAKFEVIPTGDGSVEIKNYKTGFKLVLLFKSELLPLIMALPAISTAELQEHIPNFTPSMLLFQPVNDDSGSGNVIALKSLYTNKFCTSLDAGFLATTASITEPAKLVIDEPLIKREIIVDKYRLEDARKYDLTPLVQDTKTQVNHDTAAMKKRIKLTYKEIKTQSWNKNLTWKAGFKVNLEVSTIPRISKLGLEFSFDYGGSYAWGQSQTTEIELSDEDEYEVRGKHKLTVQRLAMKGTCDIPYSYTQTDHHKNGDIIGPIRKHDGILPESIHSILILKTFRSRCN